MKKIWAIVRKYFVAIIIGAVAGLVKAFGFPDEQFTDYGNLLIAAPFALLFFMIAAVILYAVDGGQPHQ